MCAEPAPESMIRRATSADAASVLGFLEEFRAEGLQTVLQHESLPSQADEVAFIDGLDGAAGIMLVALAESRVVGCLTAKAHDTSCDFGISVLREHRGAGLGSGLVRELLAWARARGLRRVELSVFARNPEAVKLYRRLGFSEDRRERMEIGPGRYEESVRMGQRL